MTVLLDTSVVIASLDPAEPHHLACDRLLASGGHLLYAPGLAETFSVLTSGRHARRLDARIVGKLIESSVLPFVRLVHLTGKETLAALLDSERRGVRGSAIYDLLHLTAARKAGAVALVTLDIRDYQSLSKAGDPRIQPP